MRQIDENVLVSTNQNGEPVGFLWRDSNYKVRARPIRWFARRDWWLEASRVQRGIGADVLEVEVWRMLASEGAAINPPKNTQFEIAHSLDNTSGKKIWRLVKVYD